MDAGPGPQRAVEQVVDAAQVPVQALAAVVRGGLLRGALGLTQTAGADQREAADARLLQGGAGGKLAAQRQGHHVHLGVQLGHQREQRLRHQLRGVGGVGAVTLPEAGPFERVDRTLARVAVPQRLDFVGAGGGVDGVRQNERTATAPRVGVVAHAPETGEGQEALLTADGRAKLRGRGAARLRLLQSGSAGGERGGHPDQGQDPKQSAAFGGGAAGMGALGLAWHGIISF